ncbi:katanin p80 WD40 repeat-containing subunit B1 homolog KTN80.4-like isoform X2 [Phoenix dactylifera]|uniref:Katanin p80 WD40 repeat-containing subunit B1 homolog n=1 Tax=Phoenix dactylifera TaxID=42345 RepID=A0A8B9AAS4_PHODC|nr:katanin p80 WD40 repeat-containing subunit B1 homolog KTN80.4-like isoform X2 [Phoenix dactylifera]
MNAKRAYKLQEFAAHASNVNCLKIGRKTSRVLFTGGEDHKVNLWALGKPNAILSLSGHTSAVESVSFDSSEVLLAAGAASGTIKLWDLEEANVVRTLTGHRSNCISVDFHPFGEFIASGSLDTNLKIWDIRRKGCIHTYKGHTRGVNSIRFTPDGRWVVSGGEDNIVKLWDLTAGKLLHDFKCHEGQIQCIDFHPHEFLLATGSADKTVKFWDLETFEMIGSSGPETSSVHSMTFNPDGRTLCCGLHESLKVLSWEPIRCHDAVEGGWSRLSDLNVHEGKLIGCSYNQSCVGVWVYDISRIEPYARSSAARSNGHSGSESNARSIESLKTNSNIRTTMGRLCVSQNSVNSFKTSMGRLSVSQNSQTVAEETKPLISTGSCPGTHRRTGLSSILKMAAANSVTALGATVLKRSSSKSHGTTNLQNLNKSDVAPVIAPSATNSRADLVSDSRKETNDVIPVVVPKASSRMDLAPDPRKDTGNVAPIIVPRTSSRLDYGADFNRETGTGRALTFAIESQAIDLQKLSNNRDDSEGTIIGLDSGPMGNKSIELNETVDCNLLSAVNGFDKTSAGKRNLEDVQIIRAGKAGENLSVEPNPSYSFQTYDARVIKQRDTSSMEVLKGGRTRSLVASWEMRELSPSYEGPTPNNFYENMSASSISFTSRGCLSSDQQETLSASDEDAIADLVEQHKQFLTSAQSRLAKLQKCCEHTGLSGAGIVMAPSCSFGGW